ncbi:DUF6527 family protein [Solirubrum puertoriconensis]|uniref:Uncharacterized protein n=1 Tax=Solirubrum puertoriconensis TaxID=1751427 RepID=A0A9X0HNB8_SOLP1|nr:DUF6527 family protein [Solirubrum puertoriconensis]KUG09057.1 hypothetical protein ASU33_19745 [Solirubrum puertoriconensis]
MEALARILGRKLQQLGLFRYQLLPAAANPLSPDAVPENALLLRLGPQGQQEEAVLRCPCGCGQVLHLPLHARRYASFRLRWDRWGRPTVQPSVPGCRKRFRLVRGRVYWAKY